MKASILLGLIAICLISCAVSNDVSISPTTTDPSIIATGSTPAEPASQTSEPSEIAQTATSTIAPTVTLIPGILSGEELQERVDAWVNGEIPFAEEDRLLDMMTGEPLRLSLIHI